MSKGRSRSPVMIFVLVAAIALIAIAGVGIWSYDSGNSLDDIIDDLWGGDMIITAWVSTSIYSTPLGTP
jgi:steroid 5-alpha reductase family enzyme